MGVSHIDEFFHHPDYQQISSFFLGAVFITSLNYSFQWIRGVYPRIKKWIHRKRFPTKDPEKNTSDMASVMTSFSTLRSGENLSLVFALSLCFLLASLASFGSLLSFPPDGGGTCAFLVACGGVTAETASTIGMFALLLELRDLGVPNLEHYASLAALFVELVFVITNNSIGSGDVQSIQLTNDAICYEKHFLGTALTTSLIALFLEIYVLLRFGVLLARRVTLASQRLAALYDGRIGKTLSLLLFEVLTIGPSAVHITLVADFVPLSIGALIVLWTFNTYKSAGEKKDEVNPIDPPLFRSTWYSSSSENSERRMSAIAPTETMMVHPFSADYQRERSESSTTSMTTEEGIIQTLERFVPRIATGVVMTSVPRPTQAKISRVSRNVSSVIVNPSRLSSVVEQATPSQSVSPTSMLMHPWHERGGKERAGEDFSIRGLSFPMPPVGSPTDGTCRYSSSTLASTVNLDEDGEGRKKVQLLTFASAFRKS